MKIAVIGAGAMGSIYGGHLSKNHQVYLVDTNPDIVKQINSEGLKIDEDGVTNIWHPTAVTDTEGLGEMAMAIYNGLTEEYRKSIKYMEEITGKTVSCINMVGGGIQDELLCELTAKATGKRVMAGPTEGSVLGNSIVQFVASGAVGSVQEGREIIRNSFEVKVYEP